MTKLNTPQDDVTTTSIPKMISTIDPEFATRWPSPLTKIYLEELFIKAIYAKRLAEISQAILSLEAETVTPEARDLAQAATTTCDTIAQYNRSEKQRITSQLETAGVTVLSASDDTPATQIHSFNLKIPAKDLKQALAVAQKDGYLQGEFWQGGALQSLLQTRSSVAVIKPDEMTTRMTMKWRENGPRSKWLRLLQPSDVDYQLVDVPTMMWPLYHLIKPLRLIASRIFGWRPPGYLGPFLGTPTELIEPLLEAAGVTANDVVMDLGCGDGRIIVEAAQLRGCRAIGVEQDAELVNLARTKIKSAGVDDLVEVQLGDARKMDLAEVTVLFLFLPIDTVAALLPTLRQKLSPGARIIIHEHTPINPSLQPDQSIPVFAPSALTVAHLWTV